MRAYQKGRAFTDIEQDNLNTWLCFICFLEANLPGVHNFSTCCYRGHLPFRGGMSLIGGAGCGLITNTPIRQSKASLTGQLSAFDDHNCPQSILCPLGRSRLSQQLNWILFLILIFWKEKRFDYRHQKIKCPRIIGIVFLNSQIHWQRIILLHAPFIYLELQFPAFS